MDSVAYLLDEISQHPPKSYSALRRLKTRMAARFKGPLIRNDILLERYRRDVSCGTRQSDSVLESSLRLNGIRSQSGIATVTVITEPYACPGRCIYCPTEQRAPKSYLTNEPAVMRALRHNYDPYRQVEGRLATLDQTGHPTDKIELIIKGGTWSFYPKVYQREFIQRCFEAANHFRGGRGLGLDNPQFPSSCQNQGAQSERDQGPSSPDGPIENSAVLEQVQRQNETAHSRIIGITIETRPDYIDEAEIQHLRALGVTRVEMGVQSLEESVLALNVRDHGTEEIRVATQRLKDAAFKVAYHLMPNLPGATPRSDFETAREVFEDAAYQPDTLKLYPCVVVESAELYQWWKEGKYQPYDDETLIDLLIQIKQRVPPHIRIERIIRDIPSTSIQAGCCVTNLRETVQRRMRAQGWRCRCIRCRQIREGTSGPLQLIRRTYEASGGTEIFLSIENVKADTLASLLRLRIPSIRSQTSSKQLFPSLEGAALIRELHTYGHHVPLHDRQEAAAQHQGFGQRLVREAEQIARQEYGLARLGVIAGVGAREYYRRLGYSLQDSYMVKPLL